MSIVILKDTGVCISVLDQACNDNCRIDDDARCYQETADNGERGLLIRTFYILLVVFNRLAFIPESVNHYIA